MADCECCLLPVDGAPGQQLVLNRTESQLHNYFNAISQEKLHQGYLKTLPLLVLFLRQTHVTRSFPFAFPLPNAMCVGLQLAVPPVYRLPSVVDAVAAP
ncbi:hypothetical protein ACLKA6_013131 [Drosophila palustris]